VLVDRKSLRRPRAKRCKLIPAAGLKDAVDDAVDRLRGRVTVEVDPHLIKKSDCAKSGGAAEAFRS
jgi:hypothetical protein